jgi:hypothetical protein
LQSNPADSARIPQQLESGAERRIRFNPAQCSLAHQFPNKASKAIYELLSVGMHKPNLSIRRLELIPGHQLNGT